MADLVKALRLSYTSELVGLHQLQLLVHQCSSASISVFKFISFTVQPLHILLSFFIMFLFCHVIFQIRQILLPR